VGAVTGVKVVALDDADQIDLPGGSWSKMLVTDKTVGENRASLGYSIFKPGTNLAKVSHEHEEFAYVVQGFGELVLDGETMAFKAGDALHIEAGVWHGVSNPGDEDVFGFAFPDYPPTQRREG
jgi:quercetin dioxygenase-like cupin family protein